MVNMAEIVKEVTDDWVACFSDPKNQNGFMWRMAAQGPLPEGVDPEDERVKKLCDLARESMSNNDTETEIPR